MKVEIHASGESYRGALGAPHNARNGVKFFMSDKASDPVGLRTFNPGERVVMTVETAHKGRELILKLCSDSKTVTVSIPRKPGLLLDHDGPICGRRMVSSTTLRGVNPDSNPNRYLRNAALMVPKEERSSFPLLHAQLT